MYIMAPVLPIAGPVEQVPAERRALLRRPGLIELPGIQIEPSVIASEHYLDSTTAAKGAATPTFRDSLGTSSHV